MDGASGTKSAYRQVLWRLFAHCERRGCIPRRTNPVAGTQTFNGKREGAVEIWTPEEMTKLVAAADQDFLPVLAIGAFAGLRTSEILALGWRDVGALFGLSAAGGIGGKGGHSIWWGGLLRPYLAGWLMALAGGVAGLVPCCKGRQAAPA